MSVRNPLSSCSPSKVERMSVFELSMNGKCTINCVECVIWKGSLWLSVGEKSRQLTSPLQRRLISQVPRGHRPGSPWLDQLSMGVKHRLFWSSSMRIGANFWKMIVEMRREILSNWGSRLVHKKKKRKMLTPGIEPGLPKPQSGVLPLYYVSFLINTLSRCISHQSRHVSQKSPL